MDQLTSKKLSNGSESKPSNSEVKEPSTRSSSGEMKWKSSDGSEIEMFWPAKWADVSTSVRLIADLP